MKTKKLDLDVDFIGGQGPLTAMEEKALSEFFKQRKLTSKNTFRNTKHRASKRRKATA